MYIGNNPNEWEDGITHLNVITSSKYPFMRQLTDLETNEFTHPDCGTFKSIRGMFYYLSVDNPPESLREKSRDQLAAGLAKRKIKKTPIRKILREAVHTLLETNIVFREAFLEACEMNLKFVSYRYSGNTYVENKYTKELAIIYNQLKKEMESGHAIY